MGFETKQEWVESLDKKGLLQYIDGLHTSIEWTEYQNSKLQQKIRFMVMKRTIKANQFAELESELAECKLDAQRIEAEHQLDVELIQFAHQERIEDMICGYGND